MFTDTFSVGIPGVNDVVGRIHLSSHSVEASDNRSFLERLVASNEKPKLVAVKFAPISSSRFFRSDPKEVHLVFEPFFVLWIASKFLTVRDILLYSPRFVAGY